jgi:hypothetical protein
VYVLSGITTFFGVPSTSVEAERNTAIIDLLLWGYWKQL